jgi:ankyrin repeat protein
MRSNSNVDFIAYNRPASPKTPPDIMVAFPSPTQSARSLSVSRPPPSIHESSLHWSRLTPWGQFLDLVEILRQSASRNFIYLPQTSTSATSKALVYPGKDVLGDNPELVELISRQPESSLEQFFNDISEALFLNLDQDRQQISKKQISGNAFLPPSSECGSEIDVMAVLDLPQRSSQLEFLKLAVALISNNLQSEGVISALVDLCQDARNLALLQRLLDQDLPSIKAVVEKLLCPAAYHGNLELISLLVENGLDVDSKGPDANSFDSQPPLKFAIDTSREGSRKAVVKYLLNHGADPNQETRLFFSGGLYTFSMLDFAVFQGDRTIVEELLNLRPEFDHHPLVISPETFCHATKHERPCVLDFLVKRAWPLRIPSDMDPSEQCRIIEMAAFHGNLEVIKYLLRLGFDINVFDTNGYGSALVAAVFQGHTDVVHYLLSISAGANGIGLAKGHPCIRDSQSYYGFTALQASLMRNETEIARKLILSGADPNYYGGNIYCTVAPVKFASLFCDVATVEFLLQHGADPNAPDIPRSSNIRRPRLIWRDEELSDKMGDLGVRTALQIAFERGSAESVAIARILIQNRANLPPLNNTEVWDPLLSAFVGGEREIVDLVLQRGDSIPDAQKYLQACLESKKINLARGLIDDQIFHLGRDTCSPGVICAAIFLQEDPSFAHLLLSGTIEALGTLPIDYGSAALTAAACVRSVDLIQMLLTAGARPCVPCEEIGSVLQDIPLLYAVNSFDAIFGCEAACSVFEDIRRSTPCVQDAKTSINLLIDACTSSNHQSFGRYYCHHALEVAFLKASCGSWEYQEQLTQSVLKSLVISGVDVNYHSDRFTSCSALQLCTNENNYDHAAEYLLEVGADANCEARMAVEELYSTPSIFGPIPADLSIIPYHTPLQSVSQRNDVPLLKLLIKHGAEVNAEPAYRGGATALQYAAITGNFEVLNILLKAGANINAPRSQHQGRTAIEGAAEYGRLDMVCYLLEAGADVRGRENGQYRRSVYRAWKFHHRTLAKVIQEFKKKRFGSGDICSIEEIVSSMTTIELEYEEFGSSIVGVTP